MEENKDVNVESTETNDKEVVSNENKEEKVEEAVEIVEEQVQEKEIDVEEIKQAAYDGAKAGAKSVRGRRGNGFIGSLLQKIIVIVLIIMVLPLAFSKLNPVSYLADQFSFDTPVEGHDVTLENHGIFGYKAADFADVILGDSSKLKRIEVYSQDVSEMVTKTKTGLLNIKAFTKTKNYIYNGTATYVVDLSKMNADSITLDNDSKVVTLRIPHTELPENNLNVPLEKMTFSDTKKGMLAFGDIKLTDEDCQKLMKEAKEKMKSKLKDSEVSKTADKIAKMTVWEMYQPMITKTANGYTLEVTFKD